MPACFPWVVCSLLLSASPQAPEELKSAGWDQWAQGQKALQTGETDRAIELFEESLANDSKLTRNYLSLAAAWLGRGSDAKACLYLSLYVASHPDHAAVRFQYVELLQRLKRITEAKMELEDFIAGVQAQDKPAEEHLIHCHSELMQLAEATENEYEEHLHRGIGLYLLSRQRGQLGNDPEFACPEALLCKAAGELTLAARAHPDEARPHFYLHAVWSRLLQSLPATKGLRAAEEAAPFSYLTPSENRQLQLACRQRERLNVRR